MKKVLPALILAFMVLVSCGGESNTETVETTPINTANQIIGSWLSQTKKPATLAFMEDGEMLLSLSGKGDYEASYSFANGEVTITFKATAPICPDVPGTYTPSISEDGQFLHFKLVEDGCDKRKRLLSRTFKKVNTSSEPLSES